MYQLVYSSFVQKHVSKESIAKLLLQSQANNLKNNVTGCIVFHGNEFIQLLEGRKEDVQNLYTKIVKDPRHRHVTSLYKQAITARFFETSFISTDMLNLDQYGESAIQLVPEELAVMRNKMAASTVAVKLFSHITKQLYHEKGKAIPVSVA